MSTPPQMPTQAPQASAPPANAPQAGAQVVPQGPPPPLAAQPQGAPALSGYASPIPIRQTHIGHALASEWTKIRSVRSTVWTLITMFGLTVGVGLLTAVGLAAADDVSAPLLAGGFFGLMLGQLCIITLGVLVISSEYGTGMMRTTLTACPQRGRVLLAKATVFFLLAFVMTLLATALTGLIHSSMLGDLPVDDFARNDAILEGSIEGGKVVATGEHWLGATVGASLYVSLLGLLGLAVGGLLRHSAGAITAMVGVVLLPLVMAGFMVTDSLKDVREALLEYSPLNGLASLYGIPIQDEDSTGWPLLGLLAAVTLTALVGAYARLASSDA
ncbi:ABC transporter permease [Streptomyces sp. B6B3]|uniref:ABC transporter permease n=1 Tax=Streptomyces sp. B6B3 TaxID=3153570 RepID=UPI00325F140B